MLNDLLTLTSVGYDAKIELPIVDDKRWENIVQVSMFITWGDFDYIWKF